MDGTLERPSPLNPEDYEDRPVIFYAEYEPPSRGYRGTYGQQMEPDESGMVSIYKAVDRETHQEYTLSDRERDYWEEQMLKMMETE